MSGGDTVSGGTGYPVTPALNMCVNELAKSFLRKCAIGHLNIREYPLRNTRELHPRPNKLIIKVICVDVQSEGKCDMASRKSNCKVLLVSVRCEEGGGGGGGGGYMSPGVGLRVRRNRREIAPTRTRERMAGYRVEAGGRSGRTTPSPNFRMRY